MQYAFAILSSVASPTPQYFSTLSHKWQRYYEKVTEHKMCFDFLYRICTKHFAL